MEVVLLHIKCFDSTSCSSCSCTSHYWSKNDSIIAVLVGYENDNNNATLLLPSRLVNCCFCICCSFHPVLSVQLFLSVYRTRQVTFWVLYHLVLVNLTSVMTLKLFYDGRYCKCCSWQHLSRTHNPTIHFVLVIWLLIFWYNHDFYYFR